MPYRRHRCRALTIILICIFALILYLHYLFLDKRRQIFLITPTYERLEQKADLTSLAQTLKWIDKLHWIVVEDSNETSAIIERFLEETRMVYTHLFYPTSNYSRKFCCSKANPQRTHGIEWLRAKYQNISEIDGVVYFADDDNKYDIRLFNNYIRNVQSVGVWPVAFSGGTMVETPVVRNGTVTGWKVRWNPKRKFATDMAGFAVNLKLFLMSKANFSDVGCTRINGKCCLESCLLEKLNITLEDLQPFGCDKGNEILVWHMKSSANGHVKDGDKGFIV